MKTERLCWLRGRRHRFERTGAFSFAGGPFARGCVIRCRVCGHETAAVGERLNRLLEIGAPMRLGTFECTNESCPAVEEPVLSVEDEPPRCERCDGDLSPVEES